MGFVHRKLLPGQINETAWGFCLANSFNVTIWDFCSPFCNASYDLGYCKPPCLTFCSNCCPSALPPQSPPISGHHHRSKSSKILVTVLVVLATAFVLVGCYGLYVRFYSRRRRPEEEQRNETRDEFLDEDHGPVIDHPIWYIRTVGLQPSVISSITVCRYNKADGLVEGTDCSVCLSEFQEDETLRLLPKCSHAFHIPCIDTWLRSHTNCPLCRAPIVVTSAAGETPSGAGGEGSSSGEEARIEVLENGGDSDGEMGGGDGEVRDGTEEGGDLQGDNRREIDENGMQPLRRSVSLDSISAFKIRQAVDNARPLDSDRNSDTLSVAKYSKSDMEVSAI